MGEDRGKEIDIMELMEGNEKIPNPDGTWNLNQERIKEWRQIETDSSLVEENTKNLDSISNQKRKTGWKRRDRPIQKDKAPMDEKSSRKRKGDALEDSGVKKAKDAEGSEVEMKEVSQELAAVGEQPCLQL